MKILYGLGVFLLITFYVIFLYYLEDFSEELFGFAVFILILSVIREVFLGKIKDLLRRK